MYKKKSYTYDWPSDSKLVLDTTTQKTYYPCPIEIPIQSPFKIVKKSFAGKISTNRVTKDIRKVAKMDTKQATSGGKKANKEAPEVFQPEYQVEK